MCVFYKKYRTWLFLLITDPTAFYGATAFETNLHSDVSNFFGLTEFMNYRVNNMTQQLQGDLPSAGNGNGFCSN